MHKLMVFKKVIEYLLVVIVALSATGCTPQEMLVQLEVNSKFFWDGGAKYVGFGQLQDGRFVIGTLEVVEGKNVFRASVGTAKEALKLATDAYKEGWKAVTFWQLPKSFQPWLIGTLMSMKDMPWAVARYLGLGANSVFIIPAGVIRPESTACTWDSTVKAYVCYAGQS